MRRGGCQGVVTPQRYARRGVRMAYMHSFGRRRPSVDHPTSHPCPRRFGTIAASWAPKSTGRWESPARTRRPMMPPSCATGNSSARHWPASFACTGTLAWLFGALRDRAGESPGRAIRRIVPSAGRSSISVLILTAQENIKPPAISVLSDRLQPCRCSPKKGHRRLKLPPEKSRSVVDHATKSPATLRIGNGSRGFSSRTSQLGPTPRSKRQAVTAR